MTEIHIVKGEDYRMDPIDGVGGKCSLNDAFGEPDGAPVCIGMWQVGPSDEPTVFDYTKEAVVQYVLEGEVEAEMNGVTYTAKAGDFLFIPQAEDTEVKWRARGGGPFRAVYVTYPYWH
jgi:ethanolamine utilization protein EutQ (cupin superfamily)